VGFCRKIARQSSIRIEMSFVMSDAQKALMLAKPAVCQLLGISQRVLEYLELEDPAFPRSYKIKGRNYYFQHEILKYKEHAIATMGSVLRKKFTPRPLEITLDELPDEATPPSAA
jgi:predicted DNA-binding transcriptional regulator AlpA